MVLAELESADSFSKQYTLLFEGNTVLEQEEKRKLELKELSKNTN
jgi:hypothetical protein